VDVEGATLGTAAASVEQEHRSEGQKVLSPGWLQTASHQPEVTRLDRGLQYKVGVASVAASPQSQSWEGQKEGTWLQFVSQYVSVTRLLIEEQDKEASARAKEETRTNTSFCIC
jgi:hypothetical protein